MREGESNFSINNRTMNCGYRFFCWIFNLLGRRLFPILCAFSSFSWLYSHLQTIFMKDHLSTVALNNLESGLEIRPWVFPQCRKSIAIQWSLRLNVSVKFLYLLFKCNFLHMDRRTIFKINTKHANNLLNSFNWYWQNIL